MDAIGTYSWKKLTAQNIGHAIAIVLDDKVYSAPVVRSEIPNGHSQITGNFDVIEAQDLAGIIKAGKLPAQVKIVQIETVSD